MKLWQRALCHIWEVYISFVSVHFLAQVLFCCLVRFRHECFGHRDILNLGYWRVPPQRAFRWYRYSADYEFFSHSTLFPFIHSLLIVLLWEDINSRPAQVSSFLIISESEHRWEFFLFFKHKQLEFNSGVQNLHRHAFDVNVQLLEKHARTDQRNR